VSKANGIGWGAPPVLDTAPHPARLRLADLPILGEVFSLRGSAGPRETLTA